MQSACADITYIKRYGQQRREKHCIATGRHVAERTILLWLRFFHEVDAPSFSSSKLASLAKIMPLAAALAIAEFTTAQELLK